MRRVPPRLTSVAKTTIIDWNEGCLRCQRCVKEICPVDAYKKRDFDRKQFVDTIDEMCRSCYRCVQGCPRELVFKALNPQYRQLGDDYYTPEIIGTTWYQAETGKIPVSGAGYGGVFAGEGFDSFWTDMSEIVRPTRDGIHGREYISTSIDLGRKPMFLVFDETGNLLFEPPPLMELPLPVVLAEPPLGANPPRLRQITAAAAQTLGTVALMAREAITPDLMGAAPYLVPQFPAGKLDLDDPLLSKLKALELTDHPEVISHMEAVKKRYPQLIVWIRVPGDLRAPDRVAALSAAGAEVIHLAATEKARGQGDAGEVHLKDLIRRAHLKLVEHQLRDAVTLLGQRRHRPGGTRGQGHHLRRRRHHRRCPPAAVPGVPPLPGLPEGQGQPLPHRTGKPQRQAGGPAHGEPYRRLEQPAAGNPGSHGHAGGAAPAGRSGPGHVQGRPG